MLYHKLHWGAQGSKIFTGGRPLSSPLNRPWSAYNFTSLRTLHTTHSTLPMQLSTAPPPRFNVPGRLAVQLCSSAPDARATPCPSCPSQQGLLLLFMYYATKAAQQNTNIQTYKTYKKETRVICSVRSDYAGTTTEQQ